MGNLTRDQLDELAYCEADLCQNCRFFALRNGVAYGCSHPEVNDYLRGEVRCGTLYFLSTTGVNYPRRDPK